MIIFNTWWLLFEFNKLSEKTQENWTQCGVYLLLLAHLHTQHCPDKIWLVKLTSIELEQSEEELLWNYWLLLSSSGSLRDDSEDLKRPWDHLYLKLALIFSLSCFLQTLEVTIIVFQWMWLSHKFKSFEFSHYNTVEKTSSTWRRNSWHLTNQKLLFSKQLARRREKFLFSHQSHKGN